MKDARQREMKIIRIKAGLENLQIQFTENKNCKMYALIEPFTLKISIVILLTVCLSAVQFLRHWLREFGLRSTNDPKIDHSWELKV